MCPNYSLDGLLMTIDHITVYTVYKVFYVYYFKAGQIINGYWRKLIEYFCINSYSNNWESKHFKTATP